MPAANSFENDPDVEFRFDASPFADESSITSRQLTYVSSHHTEAGDPALRIWRVQPGNFLHLEYFDGVQFWLDSNCRIVWVSWPEMSSLENAVSYLFGPVLGVLLRLRGVSCLHASAVTIQDRCVAFVGSEGAGKSTTAAAFARIGYGVISDDIVALTEREGVFHVLPAYPHLCIWPETVEALFGSANALPRLTQEWDKRRLELGSNGTRFETRTLPLGAVYLLGPRVPGITPRIEELRPQPAHLSLFTNTYGSSILDNELRAVEFALLGRLVANIPTRLLTRDDDTRLLNRLCDMVRADFDLLRDSYPQ